MTILTSIILVILGFFFLIYGAKYLIDGASSIAKQYNIPDIVIGLTIVAFGTSLPELIVSIIASTQGLNDVVLGNIIGSNNFNLYIILGLTGVIYPILFQKSTHKIEIPFSIILFILLILFANTGQGFSRMEGCIFIILFLSFLIYTFKYTRPTDIAKTDILYLSTRNSIVFIIVGLIGLFLGGKFVVDYSTILAKHIGISDKIIGVVIIAFGTSLPELTTSILAALKRKSDIAIGNVIGSNIFNTSLILGITTIINPIKFNQSFNSDILILIAGTIALFIFMYTFGQRKLNRIEAAALVITYITFITFITLTL